MKRFLLGCSLAAIVSATPALAADLGGSLKDGPMSFSDGKAISWTGIYVGGQIGHGNSNHSIGITGTDVRDATDAETTAQKCASGGEYTAPPTVVAVTKGPATSAAKGTCTDVTTFSLDGLNSSGIFGGGTVGADLQRGRLVFGVFGDYNISDAKMTAGADFNGDNVFSASIEDGASWVVAGRIGYLVTDRAMLYALGGYGQQDVTYKLSGHDDKDQTFSGWVVGGGGEYALSQNIFLALEYQHFFGGKETLVDNDGLLVTDELDTDKVMAKVKIKFGQ